MAFGTLTASSQTALLGQDLRLPGQENDTETGLYHNGFRDYAPGWGRYVEADPVGLEGGIDLYTYVGANPMMFIDRWGLNQQFSFNVNGTIAVLFFGGGGGGSLGISWGDHWYQISQYQLYGSLQADGMEGFGFYGGVGAGYGYATSPGALPFGSSTATNLYGEVDVFEYSASIQASNEHCLNGLGLGVPRPRIGPGWGIWEGEGTNYTYTWATRTTGQVYNDWLFNLSLTNWIADKFYNWF
jgi:RHS repeat-associated protein